MARTNNRHKKVNVVIRQLIQAEKKYRYPMAIGRPPRQLIMVNGEAGLRCIQCEKLKPIRDFGFSHAKHLYFESMCRKCKQQYHRERKKKGLGR